MATTAEQIIEKLDSLILSCLNGTTDIRDLFEKNMGPLGVKPFASLLEAQQLREYYRQINLAESADALEAEITLVI